uniref:Calponin-homology (CH) domain-containing protein n=1 Tax=Paramormyrops kingsleyae TaxID=1676925 RepID=A0A3B3SYA5_9TELE
SVTQRACQTCVKNITLLKHISLTTVFGPSPPQRTPPLVVNDLFEDIKDGVKLLALLEVLSGQKLPSEQGRQLRRIHWVSNVGTALKFLEGRRSAYRGSPIKLVNINATDIVDGRPSIVLGLMWTIILYFQIEELTSNLPMLQSLSSSTSSMESLGSSDTASPPVKKKVLTRVHGNAKKALLKWVQCNVTDFGPSWRSGVAFHAIIHSIRPELVDMEHVRAQSNRKNLEEAFTLAEEKLGIPRLLDPEDVDVDKPDDKSIMTYVAQFLKHYPDVHSAESEGNFSFIGSVQNGYRFREQRKVLRETKAGLDKLEKKVTRAQEAQGSLADKYQSFKVLCVQYEGWRKQTDALLKPWQADGKLTVDQALVKQAWERVSSNVRLIGNWHLAQDTGLPSPLGDIGSWLHRAEVALKEDIPVQQNHEETANGVRRTLDQHKVPDEGRTPGRAWGGGGSGLFIPMLTLMLYKCLCISAPSLKKFRKRSIKCHGL